MIAARLNEAGQQIKLDDISEPLLIPNSVKIKVLASHLMSYTGEVLKDSQAGCQAADVKPSTSSTWVWIGLVPICSFDQLASARSRDFRCQRPIA